MTTERTGTAVQDQLHGRPSDATLRRFGTMASVAAILTVPVLVVLHVLAGAVGDMIDNYALANSVTALCYGILGLILVRAQPRNLLVWVLILVGACGGTFPGLINAVIEFVADGQGVPRDQVDLSGLAPVLHAFLAMLDSAHVVAFLALPTLGLLLAPDGRLPSRRWLPAAIAPVAAMLVWWPMTAESFPTPDGGPSSARGEVLFLIGLVLLIPSAVASVSALILRYRRGDPTTKRRLRWVIVAGILAMMVAAFSFTPALITLYYPILGAGFGLAIWRDQLFDVDVFISRTLLYGFLAAFIGAVYVAVVFGVGSLLGRQTDGDQALSLVATVVVAFLFHPVRVRLERLANRLVFGRRATPYEVLSDLSSRLGQAESGEGLLDRMVERLAAGTGAEEAVVWRWTGPGHKPLAVWPRDREVRPAEDLVDGTTDATGTVRVAPIERAGRRLGALTVVRRRGEELNPTEERLLDDLAGSAALVLDKARLDDALAERATALTRSRRRLVDAQDDERRRLEEQLHSSTQQRLTVLRCRLQDAAGVASADDLDPVADQLRSLAGEIRLARDEIGSLAKGIYPPVLERDGLAAAVTDVARSIDVPVEIQANDLAGGHDREIELAVYFCVAEALTNVAKHSGADRATVTLADESDRLRFEVSDDGRGFDARPRSGSSTGLAGLSDRLAAVGGMIRIASDLGVGTTVTGHVPVTNRESVMGGADVDRVLAGTAATGETGG